MTGLAENSCPSCGGRDVEIKDWQLRCRTCGWTPQAEWLDAELGWRVTAYRHTVASLHAADMPGGSLIEVMRCEQQRTALALELADLHALHALAPV